jgi:hypothetical protein
MIVYQLPFTHLGMQGQARPNGKRQDGGGMDETAKWKREVKEKYGKDEGSDVVKGRAWKQGVGPRPGALRRGNGWEMGEPGNGRDGDGLGGKSEEGRGDGDGGRRGKGPGRGIGGQ